MSNRRGLLAFAKGLSERGFELVATGGTAGALKEGGLTVTDVSAVTEFPEILGGRVKTLHPRIHGGILAVPDDRGHRKEMAVHGIEPFEVVVVNLYPFETGLRKGVNGAEQTELIDVGGPSLIRAAAKNHRHVAVLVEPDDYGAFLTELSSKKGVGEATRKRLAAKAFAVTAAYDAMIAHWLERGQGPVPLPPLVTVPMRKRADLRYGENHHQRGAFYADDLGILGTEPSISTTRQLHGKELSYNNLLDGDTAIETIKEFSDPCVVIIKHATPSGIACAKKLLQAWKDAYATDTYSPFGGIVAVNRRLERDLAEELAKVFLELVIAPSFSVDALDLLKQKKNLRILEVPGLEKPEALSGITIRSVTGGILIQDRDTKPFDPRDWKTVTKRKPTKDQIEALVFAARCAKHVKSNAVVFAKATRTVGIGGGQTARVDALHIAIKKGGENVRGSAMASDAFFPFADSVEVAAQAGVAAIVQPGGSIRDQEIIEAADRLGLAMVFSGHRSFRH